MLSFSHKSISQLLAIILLSISLSSCEQIKQQIGLGGPKDIPLGEYLGSAELMTTEKDKAEKSEVKISFLPKESGLKDAIGVLVFNNNSDRFLWRSDGNNNNIWNIMFTKDNTIYSNLKDSFEFSGIIKSSDTRNSLEGKLTKITNEKESVYYFKAFQIFKPDIETPEAPIAVKAGEEISINATKVDPEKLKVLMTPVEGEGEAQEVSISNSTVEKGVYTLTFASSKDMAKGKYKISLEREDGEKSRSITVEIK